MDSRFFASTILGMIDLLAKCRTCKHVIYETSSDERRIKPDMRCARLPLKRGRGGFEFCFHARLSGDEPAKCGIDADLWEPK